MKYLQLGERDKGIADCRSLIEMLDAPVGANSTALVIRGFAYTHLGQTEKAFADFTSVIEMPDAPVGDKAIAFINRGAMYGQIGESVKALADYTSVIEMHDAPVEQKAKALVIRGLTYWQFGESDKALADYSSVFEMPDAPVDEKAKALVSRGFNQWLSRQMRDSVQSFQLAIRIAPQGSETLCEAMFALPQPVVELGLLDDASTALRRAFEENDRARSGYAETPHHLFWMVLRRGSGDWDKYVSTLMPLYIEFGVADKLARGLTQLIERLDEGDFSPGQLDEWNAVWQKHGAAVEELKIALTCLSAATDAIKTKSDRPLFRLPQEVRSLVRSLLTHSLGPVAIL